MRTYRRWYQKGEVQSDKRPESTRPAPANKLTLDERNAIIDVCNQAEYRSLPPSQIVPTLLDKGIYYASESSFYRVLHECGQLNHRGRSQERTKRAKPTSYSASAANQVWSWDITYLASNVKGQFYYLYIFEDIYSRKIVGYEVHDKECGQLAAQLMQCSMMREQCFASSLVLHSDNGAPMKSLTMKAKLEELGVQSSYNRPRVSNDNPYSESTFRTLKYRADWPSSGFNNLAEARDWVQKFTDWYNTEHKHSKINFVTPNERHRAEDKQVLANRKRVLEAARQASPLRWSGNVRNCEPAGIVMLNPDKPEIEIPQIVNSK